MSLANKRLIDHEVTCYDAGAGNGMESLISYLNCLQQVKLKSFESLKMAFDYGCVYAGATYVFPIWLSLLEDATTTTSSTSGSYLMRSICSTR